MAAGAVTWLRSQMPSDAVPAWVVVDGGYAKREFLKPAIKAGFVVVARLRKDAALCDLPPALPPGQKRGQGRPPTYGKGRLSLAKRAGQARGWAEVTVKATTGRAGARRYKTFLATWRPTDGLVRVVIFKEDDGSWQAFLNSGKVHGHSLGPGVEFLPGSVYSRPVSPSPAPLASPRSR